MPNRMPSSPTNFIDSDCISRTVLMVIAGRHDMATQPSGIMMKNSTQRLRQHFGLRQFDATVTSRAAVRPPRLGTLIAMGLDRGT